MAIPYVTEDNTFENWMAVTNEIANNIGDLSLLSTTNKESIVKAINEIVSGTVNVNLLSVSGNSNFNGNVFLGDSISDIVEFRSGTINLNNPTNFASDLMFLNPTTRRIGFGTSNPIVGFEIKNQHVSSGTAARYGLAVTDSSTNAIGVGGGISLFSNDIELGNIRAFKEASGTSHSSLYLSSHNGSSLVHRLIINSGGDIVPGANNAQNFGTVSSRWSNINSVDANFTGTITLQGASIVSSVGQINIDSNKFVFDTSNKRFGIGVIPTTVLETKVDGVSSFFGVTTTKLTNTSGSKGLYFGYSSTTNRAVISSASTGSASGLEFWNFDSVVGNFAKHLQITETGTLEIQKNGVRLPNQAVSGSTVLDWYEEGEFFPTLEIGGTQTSSFVDRRGSYQRIGNRVFFNATIKMASVSGTGTVKIGSLPFASVNVSNKDFSLSVHSMNINGATGSVVAKIVENSSKIDIGFVVNGSYTTLQQTHLGANTIISVAGHYEV